MAKRQDKKKEKGKDIKKNIEEVVGTFVKTIEFTSHIERAIENKLKDIEKSMLKVVFAALSMFTGLIFVMLGVANMLESIILIPGMGTFIIGIILILLGAAFVPRK